MIREYQVTIICATGEYKPVSAIVKREQQSETDLTLFTQERKKIQTEGVKKICAARRWDSRDLVRLHYTKAKVRYYDKAKIEQENKERYERIKEEKYQSGEWKRPKKDEKKA